MKHGNKDNLGFLLTRAASLWDSLLMQQFKSNGILDMKPSFGSVFIPLFDQDGISAKEISLFSKLTKQTLSAYINNLEKLGYIQRRTNKLDKRSENIYLTVKGKKLQKIANEAVINVNTIFSSKISRAEMNNLRIILDKLLG
jgi:DNA-binding MarR family transcriptional regulator